MIAALHGDLDTSDGVGKVYFRQDASVSTLQQAADHINRAFPEDDEVEPIHVLVVTWADVASYQPHSRGDSLDSVDKEVSSSGLVCHCQPVIFRIVTDNLQNVLSLSP